MAGHSKQPEKSARNGENLASDLHLINLHIVVGASGEDERDDF